MLPVDWVPLGVTSFGLHEPLPSQPSRVLPILKTGDVQIILYKHHSEVKDAHTFAVCSPAKYSHVYKSHIDWGC